MRGKSLLPALVLGIGLLGLAVAISAADDKDKKQPSTADIKSIDRLIEQLGSEAFEDRDKASKALDALGGAALPALEKAAQSSDTEIKKRASDLVTRISRRVNSERILKATELHLVFKDTAIADAVADIAKKTGFKIKLHDPDGKMKDKKITLDTGKTTFWNALGQFCEKAGLIEGDPNTSGMIQGGGFGPGVGVPIVPPVAIQPARIQPAQVLPVKPQPGKEEKKEEKKDEKKGNQAETLPVAVPVVVPQAGVAQAPAFQPAPPIAVPGGGALMPGRPWVRVEQGELYLVPGKLAQKAADTRSSIRVRPSATKVMTHLADKDHFLLTLELSAEQRIRMYKTGTVEITRAIDNNDQKLEAVDPNVRQVNNVPGVAIMPAFPGGMPFMPMTPGSSTGISQYTPVKFKKGAKETKSFKELSGSIAASVLDQAEAMLVVDNVMKMDGKSVKGKKGGEINITKVEKAKDGTITIEFDIDMPKNVQPFTQIDVPIPAEFRQGMPGLPVLPVPPPLPPPPLPVKDKKGNAAEDKKDEKKETEKPAPKPAVQAQQAAPAIIQIQVGGGGGVVIGAMPLMPMPFGGGDRLRYATNGLTLQDDKGKTLYATIQMNWQKFRGIQGIQPGMKMEYVAKYKPAKDMPAEPAKLVFTGQSIVEVNVPFTLKDVEVK